MVMNFYYSSSDRILSMMLILTTYRERVTVVYRSILKFTKVYRSLQKITEPHGILPKTSRNLTKICNFHPEQPSKPKK